VKRLLIVAIVVALIVASPLSASINPQDQRYAERFSLKLNDVGSGWRSIRPRSYRVHGSDCPSAPNLVPNITGTIDSAVFRAIDGDQFAWNGTRAFSSVPVAKRWFNWSGGGELARCIQLTDAKGFAADGYKVSDLRRRRESMPLLDCDYCPPYVLRAWRISQHLKKPGDETTWYADVVTVRVQHIVLNFVFESYDYSFTEPSLIVSSVLKH
jgi:hypothetical protein